MFQFFCLPFVTTGRRREGKDHGFFNGPFFRKGNGDADYDLTVRRSIAFLNEQVILK